MFSGTHCRNEIQGKFMDKLEMCLNCKVFKKNLGVRSLHETCKLVRDQLREYTQMVELRDGELKNMSTELAIGLSEVFEALKRISLGDPTVRIDEASHIELIQKLKHVVNVTAQDIGEIVDQSHEFAMDLAEHFDVLHRVSKGDLNARVNGGSREELMEALRDVTNEMIQSIDREITERKAAEESIRKMEAVESSILSAIPHAVIGFRERKIFFANDAVEKVFGWKTEELIGKSSRILYRSDEEYEEIGGRFYPVLGGKKTYSEAFPCRRKDGRDIICMITACVIGESLKKKGIVAVYEDISEQKRMEEALIENEKKYVDLYQNAPDGYHSLGPDGTILEVNDTWLRMLGYERTEVVNKMKLQDLLAEEGLRIFHETFADLKQQGATENVDYYLRRKNGLMLPVLINATAICNKKGEFVRSRAIVRDNCEKKTYEMKLEHAAAEWRATFDSMPYGILLLDREANILRANRWISEIYQVPFHKMAGETCRILKSDDRMKEFCTMLKSKTSSAPETAEYFDTELNKYFMVHGSTILDQNGGIKAHVLSVIDISDMKESEKRVAESRDAFFNMLKELDLSYKELKGLYESLILSFVNAIDAKSPWTKGHSERVTFYAVSIAELMELKQKEIETLRIAALLHDIGKIGTYDVILDKPAKLTDEEFALIRLHPVRGEEILRPIKQFRELLPVVRHHHERLDGLGYPDGLSDLQIPLLSKIIAVADSFDSMTSDRPYRPAPPREYAISELKKCSGTQFEPAAVDAFLSFLKNSGQ